MTSGQRAKLVPRWTLDLLQLVTGQQARHLETTDWSGTPVQVTHDGGLESYESSAGKFLYYTRIGKPGIRRMALPDGQGAAVAGLETVARRNWEGSAKGIYFVPSFKPARLEFFNFSNQHVTRIRELAAAPNSVYRGLYVNPDGRTMLYLQRDPAKTNVMVVSNFH